MNNASNSDALRQLRGGEIIHIPLQNGLVVNLMNSSMTPLVAVDLWYKVGSKNEEPGRSGFAHLFEHMMFQGSENVGKAQHMKLISDAGGWMNGSTNKDRTNYFEVVPANQLRLALWLEADRMRSLAVTRENFENQRDTVKEERRMRIDNAPYARVFYELMDELVYENWAYKHSLIGSMEDLDRASLEEVQKFHRLYYRPNNAVLSVVGDLDVEETLAMIREYFDPIPEGPPAPAVDLNEPEQTVERRLQWEDKFAPLPAYVCAYHIPPRDQRDHYVMEIVEKILLDGESARLYRRFIEEDQSLLHIYGGVDSKMGPGTFFIFGQIKPGQTMKEIESTLMEEIARLQNERIKTRELQKVKNQFKSDFVTKLEKAYYKADLLCYYTTCFNDPELLYHELDHYMEITPDDIQRVAQTYFSVKSRNVIEVYPAHKN